MTRDDIIRMAREAGGYVSEMPMGDFWLFDDASFERFSALYAALAEPEPEPDAIARAVEAEREACAKEADLVAREFHNGMATYIAAAIRARGE